MTPNAALLVFWALRQEALCHDCMIGLDADGLRIVFHGSRHKIDSARLSKN